MNFQDNFLEIWKLRMDGEIDSARELWFLCKSKLDPKVFHLQLELLNASFLRAEGKTQACDKILKDCWAKNESLGNLPCFQLFFQRGLLQLYRGDRSSALSDFVMSKKFSENEFERLWALNNILSTMDHLGLPYQETLKTLLEELNRSIEAKNGETPLGLRGVKQQTDAFFAIHQFRNGGFDRILSSDKKSGSGQIQWIRLFSAELPFVRSSASVDDIEKERFYLENPVFHVNSFRARTLQGVLHQEDRNQFRWGDFADRVYLWTWRWLFKAEESSLDRLLALVSSLEVRKASEKLGIDDYQQIRNSLKWIALFDHQSDSTMKILTENFAPATYREDSWFRYEELVIDALVAFRDRKKFEHQELVRMIRCHPIHHQMDHYLAYLIEVASNSEVPAEWIQFKDRIWEWISSREQEKGIQLVIDIKRQAVVTTSPRRSILSQALCRAFEILHERSSVSCAEFLRECFGLPTYEVLIHQPKIFNLLSRLRQVSPGSLTFGVRDGSVFAEGDWSAVGWVRPSASSRVLARNPIWKQKIEDWKAQSPGAIADRRDTAQKNQLFASIEKFRENTDGISRRDIEDSLMVSRATANRIIERWVKDGFLTREGRSRNIRYRLT